MHSYHHSASEIAAPPTVPSQAAPRSLHPPSPATALGRSFLPLTIDQATLLQQQAEIIARNHQQLCAMRSIHNDNMQRVLRLLLRIGPQLQAELMKRRPLSDLVLTVAYDTVDSAMLRGLQKSYRELRHVTGPPNMVGSKKSKREEDEIEKRERKETVGTPATGSVPLLERNRNTVCGAVGAQDGEVEQRSDPESKKSQSTTEEDHSQATSTTSRLTEAEEEDMERDDASADAIHPHSIAVGAAAAVRVRILRCRALQGRLVQSYPPTQLSSTASSPDCGVGGDGSRSKLTVCSFSVLLPLLHALIRPLATCSAPRPFLDALFFDERNDTAVPSASCCWQRVMAALRCLEEGCEWYPDVLRRCAERDGAGSLSRKELRSLVVDVELVHDTAALAVVPATLGEGQLIEEAQLQHVRLLEQLSNNVARAMRQVCGL